MDSVTNVKVKLLFFISLLGILLIISTPLVNSVFVSLISPTETVPLSSSATVFVDPSAISNETLQSGSTFTVHVNVSGVTDLFTWQVNMTWDSSLLNVSSIIPGEFLALSENQTSSEALGGVVINFTNNVEGYAGMAESILGNVSGITGEGRLVSIEFLVVGYGSTDLFINVTGTLPTKLLSSVGDNMAFDPIGGYFRNKYPGDIDGDWDCDYDDFLLFAAAYLTTIVSPDYNRESDFDINNNVDYDDFLVFADNYLSTFP